MGATYQLPLPTACRDKPAPIEAASRRGQGFSSSYAFTHIDSPHGPADSAEELFNNPTAVRRIVTYVRLVHPTLPMLARAPARLTGQAIALLVEGRSASRFLIRREVRRATRRPPGRPPP